MKQIELFAGIGGFGLAGHWAGIETVCQVEIDSFCQKVLQKNFPHAHRHTDIHTFDGRQYAGAADIISGGFPCQPYSNAGKRLGKNDARHLWPEMLRVIREVRPRWVVGENVGGIISWSDGLVFEEVCADLENEGYEVQPFVLPACGVNAPHRRDRVWFVAHSKIGYDRGNAGEFQEQNEQERQERQEKRFSKFSSTSEIFTSDAASKGRKERKQDERWQNEKEGEARLEPKLKRFSGKRIIVNTHSPRWQECHSSSVANWPGFDTGNVSGIWEEWTSESPVCRVDDGFSARLDKHRNKRIKALGNAIVPQVAYQIFMAITALDDWDFDTIHSPNSLDFVLEQIELLPLQGLAR